MKKIFFLIAVLFFSLAALATPTHVRVNLTSGDNLLLGFDSKPEIVFFADGIKIISSETEGVTYEFEEVEDIDFVDFSGVAEINDKTIRVVNTPDGIEISNVSPGSIIKLFSLDGKNLYSGSATDKTFLSKSDYPSGIYILTVGSASFKIAF